MSFYSNDLLIIPEVTIRMIVFYALIMLFVVTVQSHVVI